MYKLYYKLFLFLALVLIFHDKNIGQSEYELLEKIKQSNSIDKAVTYNLLAKKVLKSNTSKSIEYANKALTNSNGNIKIETNAYLNIGKAEIELKNYEASNTALKIALKNYSANNLIQGQAYCNLLIGRNYRKLNDNIAAARYFIKSYQLYDKGKKYESAGFAAHDLLELYGDLKEIDNAEKWYKLAKENYKKTNAKEQVAKVMYLYGAYLADYGDYKKAKTILKEASKKADLKEKKEIDELIKTIDYNQSIEQKTKSNHQLNQQAAQENYIEKIEQKQALSLAEIESLSEEKQLIELKYKIEKDEYERELLVKKYTLAAQNQDLRLKNAEVAAKEAKISQQKIEKKQQQILLITAGIGLLLLIIVALSIFRQYKIKKQAAKSLALKNKVIEKQKEAIEYKSQNIEKSIQYARKIQVSLLPNEIELSTIFPNSFVFHKPKDVVSGDFIWTHQTTEQKILIVADCTGHGVPGAFISLLCANLFNQIIIKEGTIRPDLILKTIDKRLKNELNKYGDKDIKDGMDLAIITLEQNNLLFSGARNGIYKINNTKIEHYKGDRKSVGYDHNETQEKIFKLHKFSVTENDCFYLTTDGYIDQRGGNENNKFYSKRFKEILLSVNNQKLSKQKEIISSTFDKWIGNEEQMDDVTVVGFKIA